MHIAYLTYLSILSSDYPVYLTESLKKQGHTIDLISFDIDCIHEPKSALIYKLSNYNPFVLSSLAKKSIKKRLTKQPDLIIISGDFATGAFMKWIKCKYNCALGYVIGYNNLLEGETVNCIKASDFLIIHDSYLFPILQGNRYGQKKHVLYFPGMANPEAHLPLELTSEEARLYECDIVFIGGVYGGIRQQIIESLTEFNLHIYGAVTSPKLKPFLKEEPMYGIKKTKVYKHAKIVLNVEDKQINAVNPRIPETLACGGFILTEYTKDLDLYGFKEGETVACFHHAHEVVDKVKYYLSNPAERIKISNQGRTFVLENLTFDIIGEKLSKQLLEVFEDINK